MNKYVRILRWSLLVGAIYFFCIASVHLIGIKIPGFYIYFTVPSYGYQDRIISLLSFGWAVFLFTAYKNPARNADLVRAVIIAGTGAVIILSFINGFTDFNELSADIHVEVFWLEVACLVLYLMWLMVFYYLAKRSGAFRTRWR